MSAQAKTAKEEDEGKFKKTIEQAEKAAADVVDIERLKKRAKHAIEDSKTEAMRLVKRGRYAAEDFVDDTAHHIKREPWRSVGAAFGIGLSLGAVIGLLIGFRNRRTESIEAERRTTTSKDFD